MTRTLLALASLIGAALVAAGLLYGLDRRAAYRSPVAGAVLGPAPRPRAIEDLRRWRARKAEEAARRAELMRTLDTKKMVGLGREIVHGRGLCFNCHSIGAVGGGTQGPNLEGIGKRAATRVQGMNDVQYLAQSLYRPDAYIVPGFSAAMTPANQPPIGLDDLEILMVIAYLQSLGATPTVGPQTRLPESSGGTGGTAR